jgi:ATP-dependent Lhr-like helicase
MPDPLDLLSPPVRAWFTGTFGEPSPPQREGWPAIARGEHTLIMAPTGTGKTLAAFLLGLDAVGRSPAGSPGVRLLYLSPLKALSYDIEQNLRAPLAGIRAAARRLGLPVPRVTVAVRTGDTPPAERAAMVRRPPDVLVTTPESLFLILSAPRAREILRTVERVIVDEVHAVAGTKRGSHLALSLARLDHLVGRPVQRVGLSATARPAEAVAGFLAGGDVDAAGVWTARPVTMVPCPGTKPLDLEVRSPVPDLTALLGQSVWPELLPGLLDLVQAHRSTLIFVRMRAQAERITREINDLAGQPLARAHHGSLSRSVRRELEAALRAGAIRALVATGTLELGIDVGAIDLVVQLQSPGSVTSALQRIGRAGHQLGAVSRGRILGTHREDLVEATVIADRARRGEIEALRVPTCPLDVLAQQVAAAAQDHDWEVEALRAVLRRAYPYRDLTVDLLRAVLALLQGRFPGPEQRAFVSWNRADDTVRGVRGALPVILRNAGAIPDHGYFTLVAADGRTRLGELEEEFVYESGVGDVIQFGSTTWRVLGIDRERVTVRPEPGAPARMPFWKGGIFGRDPELGEALAAFRRELAARAADPAAAEAWLRSRYPVDGWAAQNLAAYAAADAGAATACDDTLVIERWRDEIGDHRAAVLCSLGARVNAPLALALRRVLRERTGVSPEVHHDDDAILLRFPAEGTEPPADLLGLVPPAALEDLVVAELRETALFGTLFRQSAARALVLTGRRPHRTPLWLQRLRARDLLEATAAFPDHPVRLEAYRECLQDLMDLPRTRDLLARAARGELRVVDRAVKVPSALTLGVLFRFQGQLMYEYDEPRAERRLRALALDRRLLDQLLEQGRLPDLLDPALIRDLEDEWQGVATHVRARDADALFQRLLDLGDLPLRGEALARRCAGDPAPLVETLVADGRACVVRLPGVDPDRAERLVAAEALNRLRLAYHPEPVTLVAGRPPPAALDADVSPAAARRERLLRALDRLGPVSADDLAHRLAQPVAAVTAGLADLAAEGLIRSGALLRDAAGPQHCTRHHLEVLRQRTLGRLRREIAPVPLPALQAFLLEHQHVAPGHRIASEAALGELCAQLAGRLVPVEVLESEVLRARGAPYQEAWLDRAVASGEAVVTGLPGAPGRRRRVALAPRVDLPLLLVAPENGPPDGPDDLPAGDLDRILAALAARPSAFLFELAEASRLPVGRAAAALFAALFRGEALCEHVPALRAAVAAGFRFPDEPARAGRGLRRRSAGGAALGRWSRLAGSSTDPDADAGEALALLALRRHGVLARESLVDEVPPFTWAALHPVLTRLEYAGEVRRGHFVVGLSGPQFALPEAVEALRRLRDAPGDDEPVLLSACDPALLPRPDPGEGVPWPHGRGLARVPDAHVVIVRGAAHLWSEGHGRRIHLAPGLADAAAAQAFMALTGLADRPAAWRPTRRLEVQEIDGAPALESAVRGVMEGLGFVARDGVLVYRPLG